MRAYLNDIHFLQLPVKKLAREATDVSVASPSCVLLNGENVVDESKRVSITETGWTYDVNVLNRCSHICNASPYLYTRLSDGKKHTYPVGGFMDAHVDSHAADEKDEQHLFTLIIVPEGQTFEGGQFHTPHHHHLNLNENNYYTTEIAFNGRCNAILLPLTMLHKVNRVTAGERVSYTFKVWGKFDPVRLISKMVGDYLTSADNPPTYDDVETIGGHVRKFLEQKRSEYLTNNQSFVWGRDEDGTIRALKENECNRWSCQLSLILNGGDDDVSIWYHNYDDRYPFKIVEDMELKEDITDYNFVILTYDDGSNDKISVRESFVPPAGKMVAMVSPSSKVIRDNVLMCLDNMIAVATEVEDRQLKKLRMQRVAPSNETFATTFLAELKKNVERSDVIILCGYSKSKNDLCPFDNMIVDLVRNAGYNLTAILGDSETLYRDPSKFDIRADGRFEDASNTIVASVYSAFNDAGRNNPRIISYSVMFVVGKY